MAAWIFLLVSIFVAFKLTITDNIPKFCKKKTSLLNGEELICKNLSNFHNFDQILNRTHWLTCEQCLIHTIDNTTLNFTRRTNLSFLILVNSQIHSVKQFAFSKLNQLKVLNLRNNSIENIYRKTFSNLNKLNQLDLSGNRLTILSNNLFVEAGQNLDLINLNRNQIFYIQPEAFAGLTNLKFLYLSDNQVEKLEANVFRHLAKLRILYLENNRIQTMDSLAFNNLNKLHALYLNNNSINFLVEYNFKPLTNLIDLQLRQNNLTEIQTSAFNGLSQLKMLALGGNQLKVVRPYGFIGLNSLQSLELTANQFDFFDLDYIRDLPSLNALWLQQNQIANFTIHFDSNTLADVISLGLSQNNLSTINYKLLYNKMPNISDVFIDDNPWKCELLVNMFNFFISSDDDDTATINLCVTSDCNVNNTKIYIEELCELQQVETTTMAANEFDTDFVTETASSIIIFNQIFYGALLFLLTVMK